MKKAKFLGKSWCTTEINFSDCVASSPDACSIENWEWPEEEASDCIQPTFTGSIDTFF